MRRLQTSMRGFAGAERDVPSFARAIRAERARRTGSAYADLGDDTREMLWLLCPVLGPSHSPLARRVDRALNRWLRRGIVRRGGAS